MTRENLANYGFIRYMGLYDDILSNILGPNEDGGSTGKKKEIYVTGRATLMNLISQTDFTASESMTLTSSCRISGQFPCDSGVRGEAGIRVCDTCGCADLRGSGKSF